MEMRQLRYFIALSEEGSFTRAADRLHITQPPLSQQIKLLEEELGARLVHRTVHGATLTEPGKVFLRHARMLVEGAKAAARETGEVASGSIGTVRIGCVNSALFTTMPRILSHLRRVLPSIDVSVVEAGSQSQVKSLLADEIDLGLLHRTHPMPGLRFETLMSERFCAVLPAGHRLATRRSIALSALADEDFVSSSREVAPTSFDQVIALCMRSGFSPRIRHSAGQLITIVQMVRLGLGVALVPDSLSNTREAGAAFVRITDPGATIELLVASRERTAASVEGVRQAIRAAGLGAARRGTGPRGSVAH